MAQRLNRKQLRSLISEAIEGDWRDRLARKMSKIARVAGNQKVNQGIIGAARKLRSYEDRKAMKLLSNTMFSVNNTTPMGKKLVWDLEALLDELAEESGIPKPEDFV